MIKPMSKPKKPTIEVQGNAITVLMQSVDHSIRAIGEICGSPSPPLHPPSICAIGEIGGSPGPPHPPALATLQTPPTPGLKPTCSFLPGWPASGPNHFRKSCGSTLSGLPGLWITFTAIFTKLAS